MELSMISALLLQGQAVPAPDKPETTVSISDLLPTLNAVRTNCLIADAQYAADYTLCVYLMKMREYYRWEHNIPFNEKLQHQALSDWLNKRESHWESLQDNAFEQVPVHDRHHDPFDAETINCALNELGYVYSSGYGRNMKPMFFLGELESLETHNDYTLVISGREYARDLASPPAMSQGQTIFVRRESLRRMLWEKVEEWRWNKPANAMKNALDCYDFDNTVEQSLDAMTDNELQSALLHEIGEVKAGELLGSEWETMLASLPHSKAEIMVRAVRDHLADAVSTLPGLLETMNTASLHFYIGNMTNMRKELFPELLTAYEIWTVTGNAQALKRVAELSATHWQPLAEEILKLHHKQDRNSQTALIELIEAHTL
jgi:hypothetical protein